MADGSASTGARSVPCIVAPDTAGSTPASAQMVAARSTWEPRAEVTEPGGGHAGHLHVEGHPHDLVVDEGPLGAEPVRAAHVAVVGGEDDDGVVPRPRRLEGGEHRAQAAVGQLVEVDVVVEVAQPGPLVGRVDVAPQPVLLVPAPLPVGLGLGVEVVVEVGRQAVDHLGVGVGEDGEGVVVLPGGGLEHRADGGHVVGVPLPVAGLVHREPHHVVGVDQGHGQEPGLGAAGAVPGNRSGGPVPSPAWRSRPASGRRWRR